MNDNASGLCSLLLSYVHGIAVFLGVAGIAILFVIAVALPAGLLWLVTWYSREREVGPARTAWLPYDNALRAYAAAAYLLLALCAVCGVALMVEPWLAERAVKLIPMALGLCCVAGTLATIACCAASAHRAFTEGRLADTVWRSFWSVVVSVFGAIPFLIGLILLGVDKACTAALRADLARTDAANAAMQAAHPDCVAGSLANGCPTVFGWAYPAIWTAVGAAVLYGLLTFLFARLADAPPSKPDIPDDQAMPTPPADGAEGAAA